VAAQVDGVLTGLAASSFTTVSLDPALVSFSIAAASKTWPDLRRADHLGVTVLADHHGALARQLAGPDTTIYREVEAGDHIIVLLEFHAVGEAGSGAQGTPPLFHRSRSGRLALGEVLR
jgi:flavin reductase (DIM6/NTAB) family NADH-FMN oxidoreductase RutF